MSRRSRGTTLDPKGASQKGPETNQDDVVRPAFAKRRLSHSQDHFSVLFQLSNSGCMAKAIKAGRILRKVRRDLKMKNGSRRPRVGGGGGLRGNAVSVLAQGAVAAPRRNFGTQKTNGSSLAAMKMCLDARIPRTIGLPRAVGPYTVIRTTVLHTSSAKFVMFCPFVNNDSSINDTKWLTWCGIESVSGGVPIVGTSNTRPISMPMSSLGGACEVVPAALTVQVMNPASLQTADGVFAMARVNQQMSLGNSSALLTYNDVATRVISYYSPRILTGGKLAIRGVKCDAYPLNMSEYSQFMPITGFAAPFTWSNNQRPAALSPIVFVQENGTQVGDNKPIDFMVTMEWRVRFDPGNPATASHTHHDITSDSTWNSLVKHMSTGLHAVEEIAETVANVGRAASVLGVL